MQKTQTVAAERKPVYTTSVKSSYGKIMLIFFKYPSLRTYNHTWNDPRMCKDLIGGTEFNFYIGKKCDTRMCELKKKGFVRSMPDNDSNNNLYFWNHDYQIILTDKGLEVYKKEDTKRKLSWMENKLREFFNLGAK